MPTQQPFDVWPNMANALEPDLKWIVDHQSTIVEMIGARKMVKTRPVKFWPDGRVRVEFVGTFASTAVAKAYLLNKMHKIKPMESGT